MRLREGLVHALAVWAVMCTAAPAFAHEFYATRVPNRSMATNTVGLSRPCITCHNNADGGAGCALVGSPPPCLNPFGLAFRTNGYAWNAALAMMDSDGDGFTNGQELQNPAGNWRIGEPSPGVAAYVTRPGYPEFNPGMSDADGDRYCWFGRDTNMDGDCGDPGENTGAFDCDDSMATANSAAVELCTNLVDDDCDGRTTLDDDECMGITDRDGDGYCPMGRDMDGDRNCLDPGEMGAGVAMDCDDTRSSVHPGAAENCIDTFDNDCDGEVDLADSACTGTSDVDGDGYCPVGRDIDGNGECEGSSELGAQGDCDDTNVEVNPGEVEICTDSIDNDCDGDASLEDADCRSAVDMDHDGHCPTGQDGNGDGDCLDAGESVGAGDCNDAEPAIHPSRMEECRNAIDDDCDLLISLADPDCAGYLDTDGDRYCFVGFDLDRNGNCTADNELGMSTDCDDAVATINPTATELCTDAIDNDCDGSVDAFDPACSMDYFDFDRDGWCGVGPDLNADRDCSDTGEQVGPEDAAPQDPTINPGADENCFDRKDNDQDGTVDAADAECTREHDMDGDGWCAIGRDDNDDGDCLDDGENIGASDCNERDVMIRPDAEELCLDFIDNDCDGDVDMIDPGCFYLLDRDGDGVCGRGFDDTADGDCLDEGEMREGADCDDANQQVNPRALEMCTDGIDNDCDERIDLADTQCLCTASTSCDDGDPCTTDRCTADMQDCEHVDDPYCGMAPDAGPDAAVGDGGTVAAPPEDGCDCRAARSGSAARDFVGVGVMLGLVVLLARRRARRRSD